MSAVASFSCLDLKTLPLGFLGAETVTLVLALAGAAAASCPRLKPATGGLSIHTQQC